MNWKKIVQQETKKITQRLKHVNDIIAGKDKLLQAIRAEQQDPYWRKRGLVSGDEGTLQAQLDNIPKYKQEKITLEKQLRVLKKFKTMLIS